MELTVLTTRTDGEFRVMGELRLLKQIQFYIESPIMLNRRSMKNIFVLMVYILASALFLA
jgi:hypothetical protein